MANVDTLQKQIEYYMSDKNLENDEFFHNLIKESKEVSRILIAGFHSFGCVAQLQQNQETGHQGHRGACQGHREVRRAGASQRKEGFQEKARKGIA